MILSSSAFQLRASDPDLFKRWLYGGIQDLGEPAVTELVLDWLQPGRCSLYLDANKLMFIGLELI